MVKKNRTTKIVFVIINDVFPGIDSCLRFCQDHKSQGSCQDLDEFLVLFTFSIKILTQDLYKIFYIF